MKKMKSVIASEMVRKLVNPNMKVEAYESKVSKETEDIFSDRFFESFDVVVNALDNIPASKLPLNVLHILKFIVSWWTHRHMFIRK